MLGVDIEKKTKEISVLGHPHPPSPHEGISEKDGSHPKQIPSLLNMRPTWTLFLLVQL